jgi:hypothetical protein
MSTALEIGIALAAFVGILAAKRRDWITFAVSLLAMLIIAGLTIRNTRPITLVCRCERFLTAPSPLRILRVDRGGLTPGVTQRFPVRSSESLVILATIFFLVADQIMRLGIGYLLGINS